MFFHGLGERAENDALLPESLSEGGGHGNRIEYSVYRDGRLHAEQRVALVNGHAQLLVNGQQFRINFVQRLLLWLRRRIVTHALVVDGRVMHHRPLWLFHLKPVLIGLEPPLKEPIGFLLLMADEANGPFIEARRGRVGFDVRDKAPLIVLVGQLVDALKFCCHGSWKGHGNSHANYSHDSNAAQVP